MDGLVTGSVTGGRRARAEALEAELSSAGAELASLRAAAADLAGLEERYWWVAAWAGLGEAWVFKWAAGAGRSAALAVRRTVRKPEAWN